MQPSSGLLHPSRDYTCTWPSATCMNPPLPWEASRARGTEWPAAFLVRAFNRAPHVDVRAIIN